MTFEELEARVKCGRYDPPPKPRKPLPDTHVIFTADCQSAIRDR